MNCNDCSSMNVALDTHLRSLIGRIWKLIPLKEQNNQFLKIHLESLSFELIGSYKAFPSLAVFPEYINIVNTIIFLHENEFSKEQCKREAFKCIRLINMLIEKYGGDTSV